MTRSPSGIGSFMKNIRQPKERSPPWKEGALVSDNGNKRGEVEDFIFAWS